MKITSLTILFPILILLLSFIIYSWYLGRSVYQASLTKGQWQAINDHNLSLLKEKDGEGPFKFIVLGDIQSGYKNLKKLLNPNVGGNLSFIIQTGDLVSHANEGHYALLLHELKNANLNLPFLVVPGNHDVKDGEFLFHTYFGQREYYFFWHKCLFIVMDNALGSPYSKQFQWLKKVLSENHHQAQYTFILMHREPIEWEKGEPHPSLKNYSPFFQLLQNFKVDYVFSGHHHDYQRMEWSGTTFISNGEHKKKKGLMRINIPSITLVEVDGDTIRDFRIPISQTTLNRVYGRYLDFSVAHFYCWLKKAFG